MPSSIFFWMYFTKLADTNVLMPLAFLLAVWLCCLHRWREAALWMVLFCGGLGIVAATKIAYIGWGVGGAYDFTGISGHAMRAAAVAPVIAILALQSRSHTALVGALLSALAFSIAIAVSRLVLHMHSLSEVLSGLLLGGALAAAFLAWPRYRRIMPWNIALVTAGALIAFAGLMAKPAPTERWIERIALYLSGHDKPYRHPRVIDPVRGPMKNRAPEGALPVRLPCGVHAEVNPQYMRVSYGMALRISRRPIATAQHRPFFCDGVP
jgi:membrane-associated phospholipid phosphatase